MLFRSVVLENDRLLFTRNEIDMENWSRTAKVGFSKPEIWNVEIPIENAPSPHAKLLQNFVDSILDGTPLIVPGAEGLLSIELANGILDSSLRGETIDFPMDAAAFEERLRGLIAASRHEKKVVEISNDDFTKSFHR